MTSEETKPAGATAGEVEGSQMTATRVAGWLLCGVLAVGIGVCGIYLAVRVASVRSISAAVAPPATPVLIQTVQAAEAPPAQATQAPAEAPAPAAAPATQPPATAISPEETRGRTFVQVGAIERDQAQDFLRKMAQKGFEARVAEGPDEKTVRILVGPLSGEEIGATRVRLEQAGYAGFARSY